MINYGFRTMIPREIMSWLMRCKNEMYVALLEVLQLLFSLIINYLVNIELKIITYYQVLLLLI